MVLLVAALSGCVAGDSAGSSVGDAPLAWPSPRDETVLNNRWVVTDGITLRLSQDRYPPGELIMDVILENHSDSVLVYGTPVSFQKYDGSVWNDLDFKENYAFTAIAYGVNAHDENTLTISTHCLREPLAAGLYRVTGCGLRVEPGGESPDDRWDNTVVYPPYQLEFIVADAAQEVP